MAGLRILALTLAIGACTTPGPAVALEGRQGTVRVAVEVVDTPTARERGLMGRTDLAPEAGMLFVWADDTTSSFWMKDTPLPLSIAFIAADGRILRLLDMDPCAADPCAVYDPATPYRTALEVRQGSFERWGVREGDRARLVR